VCVCGGGGVCVRHAAELRAQTEAAVVELAKTVRGSTGVGRGSLRTQTTDVGGGQHTDRHDGEGVGNIQDTSTDENNREHHDQCPVAILSGGHMQYAVVADGAEGESENSIGVCAAEDCEKYSSDEQQCRPHCPLFIMQGLSCAAPESH
jgi:hypothetical protein